MTLEGGVAKRPRTRAEKIRARRAREARQIELVPHESRRRPRRRQLPRRRYDIALPVEAGAEVSLPALTSLRLGSRLVSGLLLGIALWALLYAFRAPAFRVDQVAVEGADLLSKVQVRSMAHLSGQSIFQIDPMAVEQQLMAMPEVASAEVRVRWPAQVEIVIQERAPVVLWSDAGQRWWISEDGVAFLEREVRPGLVEISADVPVLNISPDPLAEAIDPEVLQAALVLCQEMCQEHSLLYDPVHGLSIETSQGWKVYFGVEGDMRLKVLLYRALAEDLARRGIQASVVSVSDLGSPYYRVAR